MITVGLPLLPLVLEFFISGYSLEADTLFLSTSIFILSYALSNPNFSLLLIGGAIAALVMIGFSFAVSDKSSVQSGQVARFSELVDYLYYLALLAIGFFVIVQFQFRRLIHLEKGLPFFEFDKKGV